jgi:hypothetical protein
MADPPIGGFRTQTARELLTLLKASKSKTSPGVRIDMPTLPISVGNFICKATSNIEPLVGSTPGSGTAVLWVWNDDDDVEETETEVKVFNFSEVAIQADKFLVGVRVGKRRVIIFESCGGGE